MLIYILALSCSFVHACDKIIKHLEWRELSYGQQADYLNAVRCLRREQTTIFKEDVTTYWEQLAYVQSKAQQVIQNTQEFLPWHRAFLAIHDHALRTKCNYEGPMPYWDWSFDNPAPELSAVWKGFGKQSKGCVAMPIVGKLVSLFPEDHCVARDWVNELKSSSYSEAEVRLIMAQDDFKSLSLALETLLSWKLHYLIGGDTGDMGNLNWSVNDPIFFLHYRNIDRLWWKWQREHPAERFTYGAKEGVMAIFGLPNIIDRLDFLDIFPSTPIAEVLNTTSGRFHDLMCYRYSNSITPRSRPSTPPIRLPQIRNSRPEKRDLESLNINRKRNLDPSRRLFPRNVADKERTPGAKESIQPKISPVPNFSNEFLSKLNVTFRLKSNILAGEKIIADFANWLTSANIELPNLYPKYAEIDPKTIDANLVDGDENDWQLASKPNRRRTTRTISTGIPQLDDSEDIPMLEESTGIPIREKTDAESEWDDYFFDTLVETFGTRIKTKPE